MIESNSKPTALSSQSAPRNSKRRWLTWLVGLIGPVLFIWILSRVDLKQIWTEIRQVNLYWLSGFVIMVVPLIMARAWRLRLILQSFNLPLTHGQALLIRWVGTAAGDLIPARAGELVSVAYLHQVGYGLGDPTLALVLDRLFDMFWMAIWSIGGLIFVGSTIRQSFGSIEWLLGLFMLGMVFAIVGLVVLRKRPKGVLSLLKKLLPQRWQSSFLSMLKGSHEHSFTFTTTKIILIMAVSLLSLVFLILRVYMLALALDLNISLAFLAASLGLATLVQLIPISNMFGIGTRDVTMVYLFGLAGISAEKALSFSMLILASVIFQDLIGLVLWWRYPVGTPFMQRPAVQVGDTTAVLGED
jgi:glycosyltransferase 2 family protein